MCSDDVSALARHCQDGVVAYPLSKYGVKKLVEREAKRQEELELAQQMVNEGIRERIRDKANDRALEAQRQSALDAHKKIVDHLSAQLQSERQRSAAACVIVSC